MKKKADAEVLRCIGLVFITLFHLHFANRCITIGRKGRFRCNFVEKRDGSHIVPLLFFFNPSEVS